MGQQLAIAVSLAILANPAGTENQRKTHGNPPHILIASSIDDGGNLVLVAYKTIYLGFDGSSYNKRSLHKVPLRDVQIRTVAGIELSLDETRRLLGGKETPILASSWNEPLSKFWRELFSSESLLFVFPQDTPVWKQIQEPGRPIR